MENMGKHRQNLNDFLEEAELQQYSELFRDVLKISKISQLKFVVTEDLDQIGLSRPEQRRYKKIFSKYFPNPYIYKLRKLLSSHKRNEPIRLLLEDENSDSSYDDENDSEVEYFVGMQEETLFCMLLLVSRLNLSPIPRKKMMMKKKWLSWKIVKGPCSQGHTSIPMDYQSFNDNNVKIPTKHIICIEDITINKELGKGQFGVVQQGTWSTGNQRLQVAIKCLGQERMTSNSAEFLKEAAVMHGIEHPNIVRLYGVVLHSDSLMLVTELAPLRSLLECLREVSLRADFLVPSLCEFAEQICDGMNYLENKRLIHRDLAARNILVFSKDKVKISDFGLSRALGVGKDYYQTNYNVNLKLPVAWCAPECILFLRFTSASDVWAFGVCLWEMFTYGFQPWAGFSGQQILEAIDNPNCQRLERPQCCPEAYYTTMLECWSHEPNNRPKFRELGAKLRTIRPEQVQTTSNFQRSEEARRSNFLEYRAGQIITVLGKENMTHAPLWYGVVSGGACGVFDPNHTKPYVPPDKCLTSMASLSPNPTRHSARSIRSTLLRCDVKRHTFTGKRTIQRSMISSPQGDVKHTGHVGLDGAYFGDISFLDPAGCPPRQIVTPYKPSEDLEQVPLINPNSPSHLTGVSGTTPYPMLASNRPDLNDCEEGSGDKRNIRKGGQKHSSEPTGRSLLNKVKCATLGRPHKADTGAVPKTEEVHEYHEISDNDTLETAPTKSTSKHDSLHATKSSADFSQSLIDEMESLFRNLDTRRREEPSTSTKHTEGTMNNKKAHTLTKDKRRLSPPSTMKPMSAHDEKTLNTAVALANEITSKSMNDLGVEKPKYPHSPNDRSKFHFKFPLSLHHHGHHSHEPEKERDNAGKQERRNFSEEAKSVPDIQSTLTAESKMAYTSLIEEPTPSTSLMSHLAKESTGVIKPATIPKPAPHFSHAHFHSLQKNMQGNNRPPVYRDEFQQYADNPLPLPPRTTKPKLIDKPRHIRKYPLKIPGEIKPAVEPTEPPAIIYQNTSHALKRERKVQPVELKSVDVHDGPEPSKLVTNPFKHAPRPAPEDVHDLVIPGPSGANPFKGFPFDDGIDDVDIDIDLDLDVDSEESEDEAEEAGALVKDCKDHVSVEDLLEFADLKPCGRQRGVESDEVRIMSKVFKKQVSPEECLEALELSDWNVHNAIKLVRVSVSVGTEVSLEDCSSELAKAKGDITKASAVLVLCKQKT